MAGPTPDALAPWPLTDATHVGSRDPAGLVAESITPPPTTLTRPRIWCGGLPDLQDIGPAVLGDEDRVHAGLVYIGAATPANGPHGLSRERTSRLAGSPAIR